MAAAVMVPGAGGVDIDIVVLAAWLAGEDPHRRVAGREDLGPGPGRRLAVHVTIGIGKARVLK